MTKRRQKELDTHIKRPCKTQDIDPFQSWATKQNKFPNVADAEGTHLGIPVTLWPANPTARPPKVWSRMLI